LIIHGTADATVPLSQSETFASQLKKAGARHELIIVEGATHTFDLQAPQMDRRPALLGFLDKRLRAPVN
jgi:dipeptidyl aminopeptidase/acylaminoacyl peptidase